MTQVITVDQECVHNVSDANDTDVSQSVVIQPDNNGLSIMFPNGQILVIDLASGEFNVYHCDENGEIKGHLITI